MSRKYPSAAGADPDKLGAALAADRPKVLSQEDYEDLVRAVERSTGEERESAKRRLFREAGLPGYT